MVSMRERGTYAGLPCSIAYSYQDLDAEPASSLRPRKVALTSSA
jgi:hypothetical protein